MKPVRQILREIANAFRAAPPAKRPGMQPNYRMYHAAKNSRLTTGWGSIQTSADAEITSSLRSIRSRSREDVRDKPFAKRAKTIVVNNVIGPGIGLQAQVKTTRGGLHNPVNDSIESNFEEWGKAENCHTGGRLHFPDIERLGMGEIFEAGEIFFREHLRPFGNSPIPYALEVIEPERVIDEFQPSPIDPRLRVRMGVEIDEFHRPIAYWIRKTHPGDIRLSPADVDFIERVPADQIIHLGIIDRWPQTRSVPWMHATMRKLNDTDGYSEAEIIRARDQASISRALKTDREYGNEVKDADGNVVRELPNEPGMTEVLYHDEEMQYPPPSAPNSSADPFLRFMLREIAAGTGISYESLSRDYSQSNYSSSRLALLDDRDLWRMLQLWFIRSFRQRVHRRWLQQAILVGAIPSIPIETYALDPFRYEAARYKPRGWSWIDPEKEVKAYKEAIKAGITTRTDVIAQTANGRDREDIDEERAQELEESKEMGLVYDTDPDVFVKQVQPAPKQQDDNQGDNQNNSNGQGQNNGRTQRIHSRV